MFNIRKNKIAHALRHIRRKVVFPDLPSVHSVGYLFVGEPQLQDSFWAKTGHKVSITYLSFVEGKRGKDTRTDIIYSSDLNLWKMPPDRLVKPFADVPFDILFVMNDGANEVLTYIAAVSSAHFKVGHACFENLFDLVVDLSDEHKYRLTEEVVKILANLKPKV